MFGRCIFVVWILFCDVAVCFHVSVQTYSGATGHGDGFHDIGFSIYDAFAPTGACHFHAEGVGDTAVTAVIDGTCGTALVAGNEEDRIFRCTGHIVHIVNAQNGVVVVGSGGVACHGPCGGDTDDVCKLAVQL